MFPSRDKSSGGVGVEFGKAFCGIPFAGAGFQQDTSSREKIRAQFPLDKRPPALTALRSGEDVFQWWHNRARCFVTASCGVLSWEKNQCDTARRPNSAFS
jgi:hypothetical protein